MSPRKMALVARNAAKESLPEYAHANSPEKFTQHRLFACRVRKKYFKLDDRGIHGTLADCSDMRRWIGLNSTPHFTTWEQAQRRLLGVGHVRRLLQRTVEYGLGRGRPVRFAAGDSTGMRSDRESRHYTRRRAKTSQKHGNRHTRIPKVGLLRALPIMSCWPRAWAAARVPTSTNGHRCWPSSSPGSSCITCCSTPATTARRTTRERGWTVGFSPQFLPPPDARARARPPDPSAGGWLRRSTPEMTRDNAGK